MHLCRWIVRRADSLLPYHSRLQILDELDELTNLELAIGVVVVSANDRSRLEERRVDAVMAETAMENGARTSVSSGRQQRGVRSE